MAASNSLSQWTLHENKVFEDAITITLNSSWKANGMKLQKWFQEKKNTLQVLRERYKNYGIWISWQLLHSRRSYKRDSRRIYFWLGSSPILLSIEFSLAVYTNWIIVGFTCLCRAHSHPTAVDNKVEKSMREDLNPSIPPPFSLRPPKEEGLEEILREIEHELETTPHLN